jgi:hypothetical protein
MSSSIPQQGPPLLFSFKKNDQLQEHQRFLELELELFFFFLRRNTVREAPTANIKRAARYT